MKSTDTIYYVMVEDSLEEEACTWAAIEDRCRQGQFTADTRIFFPDKNKWVRAGETELRFLFEDGPPGTAEGTVPAEGEAAAEEPSLEAEYREALDRIKRQPESVEGYVEAGRLAVERGDRHAAREHFQSALYLQPFNSRVAKEVMRRFSKSECRDFQYLRRDPAVWDEPADLLTYPMAAGPLYIGIPAAVVLLFSFIPYGEFAAGLLAYLWFVQVARRVAEGSMTPPLWERALANPAREIILPLLAGAAVAGECALVTYGVGRAAVALEGAEASAFRQVAGSPVLSVTLSVIGLTYLPAVLTKAVHSVGVVVQLLNPYSVIRSMTRMGQEYVVSALTVLVIAAVLGGARLLLGGIPLIGKLVFAAAAAWAVPVSGLVVGRLAGRMQHVL